MAYTGRLRPKLIPLSGWVEILLVKVHEKVGKSAISVYKRTIKGLTVASYKTLTFCCRDADVRSTPRKKNRLFPSGWISNVVMLKLDFTWNGNIKQNWMQDWKYGKRLTYLANSCIFEKDKKTSWINDLFILRRRLHLQQLKEWGVLKGHHLSIEGIRNGYLFCQKWYIKGNPAGTRPWFESDQWGQ